MAECLNASTLAQQDARGFRIRVMRILASILATLTLGGLAAAADNKPNVLFLFADDLGRYASAYADPEDPSVNDIIKTPVFDRIAEEGALFTNAFVSAPSCTPCRGSVYSGRHFFRNGSSSQLHMPWDHTTGIPDPFEKVVGMPMTFKADGYHIGYTYKWHTKPGLIGEKENRYQKHGGKMNGYSFEVGGAADMKAKHEELMAEVRGNFQDFLDARKEGQPFFYSFNPTNPHRKWLQGSGKKIWGLDPDDLKGKMPPFLPDTYIIREDFADYLGEAMAFDAACGEILNMVEEMGELDNTLVCISGDHGIPGYPRGKCNVTDFGSRVLLAMRWPKGIEKGQTVEMPVSHVDLAPTFLAVAGLKQPESDDPNGQDLIAAMAGKEKLREWALIGKERHVHVGQGDWTPYPIRALRTPDFLYIINFKPDRYPMGVPNKIADAVTPPFEQLANNTYTGYADMDASPTKAWLVENRKKEGMEEFIDYAFGKRPKHELYDLMKDRHQMNNLAGQREYEEIQKTLHQQLMKELRKNEDPRLDDAFDRPPYLVDGKGAKRAKRGK